MSDSRRLCAGDWVTPIGQTRSVRGIGKLADGVYEDEDDALAQAHVEFARGTFWFPAGDLLRVEPEDEARICEAALAGAVIPEAQANRLRTAIDDFRTGRRSYVRTPLLLDLLWSFLPFDHRPEVSGLARFFEGEAHAVLPMRATSDPPRHLPPPVFVAPVDRLPNMLKALPRGKLLRIAELAGLSFPNHAANVSNERLRAAIIESGVDGPGVIATLEPRALRAAYNYVARPKAREHDTDEELRQRLLAAFDTVAEAGS